jgi:tetratricopeptide (TPR) repeat protein
MSDASANRVFISCVSKEFEEPEAPFPGLRGQLRLYLTRAGCEVKVQEEFRQRGDVDTVEKLADYIRDCAAVIHLVGELPGAVANKKAVADYLAAVPEFLENYPDLRAALGDCADLTYTQWEAFLALHYGKPLFVYATDRAAAQQSQLDRLRSARKFAAPIRNDSDLLGQLIGDIHSIIASVPRFTRHIAPSRINRHAPKILFGREPWLDALDAAWAKETLHVYTLVAWGGVGKTSLVAHWVSQRLAAKGWPGVERYFDWSFYSQGTGESRQTSSDLFIQEALKFFDDPDPIKGGPWERGERLAGLIRRHRTLLVLDGIEPLQYPLGEPQAGRLKDQALEALVQGLAADNFGLCLVTTREHLTNLESQATTEEQKLDKLPKEAALALLRHLQIVGTEAEMEAAWRDAGGHALTLQLLGRFIADAYEDRDIRHYKEVKLEAADLERQGRSAFKVMVAYERWLQAAGPARQRELAVLRLTGLFDRPMARACLQALRAEPAIPGLTEALVKLTDPQWNIALKRLGDVDLLTVTPEAIDAHPLIREYFAKQLRESQPEAFRAAHARLFEHLCKTTPYRPDDLAGLAPLYQAVVHGCLAGRQQEACKKVYRDRILRGTGPGGNYSTFKLGAVGADLGAVAAFFVEPWSRLSSNVNTSDKGWLLSEAAYSLRALGRLTEAVTPLRVSVKMGEEAEDWKETAKRAGNLSELELTLGLLAEAAADAQHAIDFANRSGNEFRMMWGLTNAADALHQAGKHGEANALFAKAERMQAKRQPHIPLLYSLLGFRYIDLLLAPAERAAWQVRTCGTKTQPSPGTRHELDRTSASTACAEAEGRAKTNIEKHFRLSLLSVALDYLALARAQL